MGRLSMLYCEVCAAETQHAGVTCSHCGTAYQPRRSRLYDRKLSRKVVDVQLRYAAAQHDEKQAQFPVYTNELSEKHGGRRARGQAKPLFGRGRERRRV